MGSGGTHSSPSSSVALVLSQGGSGGQLVYWCKVVAVVWGWCRGWWWSFCKEDPRGALGEGRDAEEQGLTVAFSCLRGALRSAGKGKGDSVWVPTGSLSAWDGGGPLPHFPILDPASPSLSLPFPEPGSPTPSRTPSLPSPGLTCLPLPFAGSCSPQTQREA